MSGSVLSFEAEGSLLLYLCQMCQCLLSVPLIGTPDKTVKGLDTIFHTEDLVDVAQVQLLSKWGRDYLGVHETKPTTGVH